MIKHLVVPNRTTLTNTHELHLCEPNKVKGWNVTHVSTVVRLIVALMFYLF